MLRNFKKVSIFEVKNRDISSQKPFGLEQPTNKQMGVVTHEAINQLKALMDQGSLTIEFFTILFMIITNF